MANVFSEENRQCSAAPMLPEPNSHHQVAKTQRIMSLDILRGFTMAVMLFVDEVGGAYPSIGHAPWTGIHLADFVMPYFLFISGASMSISLKVRPGSTPLRVWINLLKRVFRLFIVGLFVQGAFDWSNCQFDLSSFRVMGILQRIAFACLIVGTVELFVPHCSSARSFNSRFKESFDLFKMTVMKWAACLIFFALGTILTYGVKPPASWPGCNNPIPFFKPENGEQLAGMGCSSVGWLDTSIFGVNHVYRHGGSKAGGEANWGFDPEGFITTLSAVITMYFGLHIGRVWAILQDTRSVLLHWLLVGIATTILSILLTLVVPFSKRLWSPSYNFFMCGTGTLLYATLFVICDAHALHQASPGWLQKLFKGTSTMLQPFRWLGSNAILFFVMSPSDVLQNILQTVTWKHADRSENIVHWFTNTILWQGLGLGSGCHMKEGSDKCGPFILVWVCVQLIFWIIVCGVLFRKNIFWKI